MLSTRTTFIAVIAVIAVFVWSDGMIARVQHAGSRTIAVLGEDASGRTPRPLPETRSPDNPLSVAAVRVPKEVTSIPEKPSFVARILNRTKPFAPIADAIFPKKLRNDLTKRLAVTDILTSRQIYAGGPAVIARLRKGNVALTSPGVLGVYFNEEGGQGPGIGGNLFSTEPWTGPYTETECGVGFYEVLEVSGTEYCDVIRYDFYDADPNRSIAIALSVTEEQYCDAQCTQPSCKAVCEALVPDDPATPINESLNTAYFFDESTGLCGCGAPIYTASCVDSAGGPQCVQVPGGDGQSTCATNGDCAQTHFSCVNNACTEVGGSGIDQCSSDTDCFAEQTHTTCVGYQCVTVPEPGEDECLSDAQCTGGTTRWYRGCLDAASLTRQEFFTAMTPRGESLGPQCALLPCLTGNCTDTCTIDSDCPGFEAIGPTGDGAISSREGLVPFPQPIVGDEFTPPPLPELGAAGTGGQTNISTCSDSGGPDIDGDGIGDPDGIWDACVVGGESAIQCGAVADCLRTVHSQCAGQQCVIVNGPGINQCGAPANLTDVMSLDSSLCTGGCGPSAQTILGASNVTITGTSCDAISGTNISTSAQFQQMVSGNSCTVTGATNDSCSVSGPLTILQSIMNGLRTLTDSGCSFAITALANGIHSAGSRHYVGEAVDIDTASAGFGTCTNAQVTTAFCGLGLHVNNEANHLHVGSDDFADICP